MDKRQMKKGLAIVLALVMVFAMTATAFAANVPDTDAYYHQNDNADKYVQTSDITVYVTVESNKVYGLFSSSQIMESRIPVALEIPEDSETAIFSVTDALVALQDGSAYTSYDLDFLDSNSDKLEKNDTYFYKVKQNGTEYGPTALKAFNGWMVRVNDCFVLGDDNDAVGGLCGKTINEMYLEDGDEIHLYMDNTTSVSKCVPFTKLVPNYSGETLQVTVQESHNYFGSSSPYPWTITSYATYTDLDNKTLTVYDSNNQQVGSLTVNDGVGNSSISLTAGQKYHITLENDFDLITGNLKYTSAYTEFTA